MILTDLTIIYIITYVSNLHQNNNRPERKTKQKNRFQKQNKKQNKQKTDLKDKSVVKVGGSKHHRRPLVGVLQELRKTVCQPLKGSGAELSLSDEHSKPELQPHPPEDCVPVDLKQRRGQ